MKCKIYEVTLFLDTFTSCKGLGIGVEKGNITLRTSKVQKGGSYVTSSSQFLELSGNEET